MSVKTVHENATAFWLMYAVVVLAAAVAVTAVQPGGPF